MASLLPLLFWLSLFQVGYTYVLYPLAAWLRARRRPGWRQAGADAPRSVSVLLAAKNEEQRLDRRLEDLLAAIRHADCEGEIIVGSDGSTDGTVAVAESFASQGVRLLTFEENRGKAAVLSAAAAAARHEVLVMADARQTWAPDALARLLENFADAEVGAVSGDLALEQQPGVLAGVGLYWRFEKWLRRQESRIHSQIGVTGAIAAVRRELFRPIPPGIILDDVYWPMQVVLQGRRVVHDDRAVAVDRLPETAAGELRRKIRTLVGNFQLVAAVPALLVPWRNPAWLAFVSHKLMRLAAPWTMLTAFVASAALGGWFYGLAFAGQAALLIAAMAGLWTQAGARNKLCSAAGSFLLLHAAAWCAFWYWISGRTGSVWTSSAVRAPREGAAVG